MNLKKFTLIAMAIMLFSLFAVSAMAADQDRDRDQDCTNAPEEAPMEQKRLGVNAQTTTVEITGDGICDGNCDGYGSQNAGNCNGDQTQDRKRDGSCTA